MGFFEKLKSGLKKTKDFFAKPINALFLTSEKVDDGFYEELFDLLVISDVGVSTAEEIVETLKIRLKEKKIKEPEAAKGEFIEILSQMMGEDVPFALQEKTVVLVVGVNGVGKTTTIGKIALAEKRRAKR